MIWRKKCQKKSSKVSQTNFFTGISLKQESAASGSIKTQKQASKQESAASDSGSTKLKNKRRNRNPQLPVPVLPNSKTNVDTRSFRR
ncbi:unnamed protein product [Rhizophagus irregularis]|uniref:Uncharacterized protein n=1 Tax=Rhizophagus irregularis TaxID=588596 RepID=A0A916EKM3_9GLOM|nr:unnamed protein product [Rhizophagus irregularis]